MTFIHTGVISNSSKSGRLKTGSFRFTMFLGKPANCVADWLANHGHSLCLGLHVLCQPLSGCSLGLL